MKFADRETTTKWIIGDGSGNRMNVAFENETARTKAPVRLGLNISWGCPTSVTMKNLALNG